MITAPLSQRVLAVMLTFGMGMIVLGEGYVLGVLLRGLPWNPLRLVRGFAFLAGLISLGDCLWLVMLLGSDALPAPNVSTPPEHLWLMKGGETFVEGGGLLLAIVVLALAMRLGTAQPPKERPRPKLRWIWLFLTPAIGITAGLLLGVASGFAFGTLQQFDPLLTTIVLPVLHWPFQPDVLVILGALSLPFGVVIAGVSPLSWQIERLSWSCFAPVGAGLIAVGSVVLGVAFWLVP